MCRLHPILPILQDDKQPQPHSTFVFLHGQHTCWTPQAEPNSTLSTLFIRRPLPPPLPSPFFNGSTLACSYPYS
jgi:hypothetical protein